MPENAPCCVLEVLQPSAECRCALASLSLPVPSVLNIRPAAKQHNVLQLTCSSHNLAPVCYSIHMANLSSRLTLERMPAMLFCFFLSYQALSRQTQLFSFSLLLLSTLFCFLPMDLFNSPLSIFSFFILLSQVISGHIFGLLTSCGSKKSFVRWLSKLFGFCLFRWGIYSAQRFAEGITRAKDKPKQSVHNAGKS